MTTAAVKRGLGILCWVICVICIFLWIYASYDSEWTWAGFKKWILAKDTWSRLEPFIILFSLFGAWLCKSNDRAPMTSSTSISAGGDVDDIIQGYNNKIDKSIHHYGIAPEQMESIIKSHQSGNQNYREKNEYENYFRHQERFVSNLKDLLSQKPDRIKSRTNKTAFHQYCYMQCYPKSNEGEAPKKYHDQFFNGINQQLIELNNLLFDATNKSPELSCLLCYSILCKETFITRVLFGEDVSASNWHFATNHPKKIKFYCQDMTNNGEWKEFYLEKSPTKTIFNRFLEYADTLNDIKRLCHNLDHLSNLSIKNENFNPISYYDVSMHHEFSRSDLDYFNDDDSISMIYKSNGNYGDLSGSFREYCEILKVYGYSPVVF